jgi:hypothetical protein
MIIRWYFFCSISLSRHTNTICGSIPFVENNEDDRYIIARIPLPDGIVCEILHSGSYMLCMIMVRYIDA